MTNHLLLPLHSKPPSALTNFAALTYVHSSLPQPLHLHTYINIPKSPSNIFTPILSQNNNSNSNSNKKKPEELSMTPIVLTQLATGFSVLAGAVIVKQVMDENTMMGSGRTPRCPSCNGSGHAACMCSRWSDGDFGCRTCAGSGRTACSSCGGSGTGRPIPVRVTVDRL